ncbi:pentapeptide repeat-containing protein [Streptomyces sp. ISL-99]|uniref:pentapeptide repeat-containing protein n=1 Tax=Streptomyces sp. ISL-99 TaxID=2819193 RepID=UPI0035ADA12F
MREANLRKADAGGAVFRRADLRLADLRGSDLSTADLLQTRLTGAAVCAGRPGHWAASGRSTACTHTAVSHEAVVSSGAPARPTPR